MTPDSPSGGDAVPAGWRTVPLGEVVDILDSQRRPLNATERAAMKGEYPYYGANGVVDSINQWLFDEPLVLVAEDGGHFDEFDTRPIAYKVTGRCWVNNHAHVLRPRAGLDVDWLLQVLVHRDLRPYIHSSTLSKLNQADLRRILIPLPPLAEQRRMAAILASVEEVLHRRQRVVDGHENPLNFDRSVGGCHWVQKRQGPGPL